MNTNLSFYQKALFLALLCITTHISAMLQLGSSNIVYEVDLLYLAQHNHEEEVIRLINKGTNVNARCIQYNTTPLHLAARAGHANIVKILLDSGALVNPQSDNGTIPLSCALKIKNIPCIELLLEHGADQTIKDSDGYTPIYWLYKDENNDFRQPMTKEGRQQLSRIVTILLCNRLEKLQ